MLFGRYEMSLWDFKLFAAQLPREISWWEFMLLGVVTSYEYQISCFVAVMICLDEISCFLAADFSFWWCDVRTVDRWMLKDADDWVYTTVYWTLHGFVCASWAVRWRGMNVSFVVVVGKSASALGDRRVCVEVVWFVSPACIISSRYVCLKMK